MTDTHPYAIMTQASLTQAVNRNDASACTNFQRNSVWKRTLCMTDTHPYAHTTQGSVQEEKEIL